MSWTGRRLGETGPGQDHAVGAQAGNKKAANGLDIRSRRVHHLLEAVALMDLCRREEEDHVSRRGRPDHGWHRDPDTACNLCNPQQRAANWKIFRPVTPAKATYRMWEMPREDRMSGAAGVQDE